MVALQVVQQNQDTFALVEVLQTKTHATKIVEMGFLHHLVIAMIVIQSILMDAQIIAQYKLVTLVQAHLQLALQHAVMG